MWQDLIRSVVDGIKDALRPENIVNTAVDLAKQHPEEAIEIAKEVTKKAKEAMKG